jgi:hypothetical protein
MHVNARMWVPLGRLEPASEVPPPAGEAAAGAADRKVYVCDMHREEVGSRPGKCAKCGAMELTELAIPPGSLLIFTCTLHPEVKEKQPGPCPRDGKPLEFRVVAEPTRVVTEWMCPIHPFHTSPGKAACPDSGREFRPVRREDLLAVPVSAVIDTGSRKSAFIDRGGGVFEAVAVTVRPRAGSYYPVLSGLRRGDKVVTAGAFLLDAEVHLNPAAAGAYFGATGHEMQR